jgi:hypothetical protein
MTPKLRRKTRRQESKETAPKGRRRTKRLTSTNAGKRRRDHSLASERLWAAIEILEANGTHYLIRWDGTDPATGAPYEPTWEPHDFVTSGLEAAWKETIAARDDVAGHIGHEAQPHKEASTDSLLVGSQGASDTGSQINDNLANNTMTASNETSGSHQYNSAGVSDTNNNVVPIRYILIYYTDYVYTECERYRFNCVGLATYFNCSVLNFNCERKRVFYTHRKNYAT